MPNPSGVPAFGGYFTERVGVNTEHVYAWWADGSLARWEDWSETWEARPRPDFAALFPDRVRQWPDLTQDEKLAEMARRIPMHFRGDLPAQPRPDDADDREYPARGGRDD